jgi:hypothetical protein
MPDQQQRSTHVNFSCFAKQTIPIEVVDEENVAEAVFRLIAEITFDMHSHSVPIFTTDTDTPLKKPFVENSVHTIVMSDNHNITIDTRDMVYCTYRTRGVMNMTRFKYNSGIIFDDHTSKNIKDMVYTMCNLFLANPPFIMFISKGRHPNGYSRHIKCKDTHIFIYFSPPRV